MNASCVWKGTSARCCLLLACLFVALLVCACAGDGLREASDDSSSLSASRSSSSSASEASGPSATASVDAQTNATSVGLRAYPDYGGLYTPDFKGYANLVESNGTTTIRSVDGRFFSCSVDVLADRYPAFASFASVATYPMPGLEKTRLSDDAWCESMVPQGLCILDDYILVSAYCSEQGVLEELENGSAKNVGGNPELLSHLKEAQDSAIAGGNAHECVLQVLDKRTGRYMKTLVLEGVGSECHVGGLAYAGGSVWVALSKQFKSNGDVAVLRLDKGEIDNAMNQANTEYASVSGSVVNLPDGRIINSASFLTSTEGRLWVGYFLKDSEGKLLGYKVDGDTLVHDRTYMIPNKANGATFIERDGEEYLLVNQSYGRNADSSALLFSTDSVNEEDAALGTGEGRRQPVASFKLPPMLEEACVDDGKLYTIYESGATCYSCLDGPKDSSPYEKRCQNIVDYLCVCNVNDIVG